MRHWFEQWSETLQLRSKNRLLASDKFTGLLSKMFREFVTNRDYCYKSLNLKLESLSSSLKLKLESLSVQKTSSLKLKLESLSSSLNLKSESLISSLNLKLESLSSSLNLKLESNSLSYYVTANSTFSILHIIVTRAK
jgi:hypothetical protein